MKFDVELKRQHDSCKEQRIRLVGDFCDTTDEGQYYYEADIARAFVVRNGRERAVPLNVLVGMNNSDWSEKIYESLRGRACTRY